jgi:hypothetical protein
MARRPRLSLLFERQCALAAAVLGAVVCWWQWGRVSFPISWKELLGAVFTASATGAGFLFTAASILISMDQRPILKWGRQTGAYALLANYLTRGIWWCLAAALMTLAMFIPDFGKPAAGQRLAFCCWLAATTGAAVAVIRVLLIFATILRQVAKDEES